MDTNYRMGYNIVVGGLALAVLLAWVVWGAVIMYKGGFVLVRDLDGAVMSGTERIGVLGLHLVLGFLALCLTLIVIRKLAGIVGRMGFAKKHMKDHPPTSMRC